MIWLLVVVVVVGAIVIARKSQSWVASPEQVTRLAQAIARAEGYYVAGSLPARLNNPGSLKDPITGQLRYFATPEEGWAALQKQVRLILEGKSLWYKPDMSISEIARIWTGGDNPEGWARTVSQYLGVSPEAEIRSV